MQFPKSDIKKPFKRNSIFEVVFQAQFPQLLEIEEKLPVEFQNSVRDDYPELQINLPNKLPNEIPEEVRNVIMREIMNSGSKNYYFLSENNDWRISLSKESLSLSNHGTYKDFEEFLEKVSKLLTNFESKYKPAYYTRIGLRFRNIISPKIIGKEDLNWQNIIPNVIASEFNDENLRKSLSTFQKVSNYQNEEGDRLNLLHSFSKVAGKFKGLNLNKEEAYIIDIDCYNINKTKGINDVIKKLNIFRGRKNDIFAWSTTPEFRALLDE